MAPTASAWHLHVERALEPEPEPQRQDGALCFEASKESIAFLRLLRGVPECIRNAAKKGQFCAIVQEPGAATAWVPRALLPKQPELSEKDGAEEVEKGFGWCAMCMGRSTSGKGGLNVPGEPGVAAKICSVMAEAAVNVRLLTAFDVDVLLVSEKALPQAAAILVSHGHAVWPSMRVCNPSPWQEIREKPSESQLTQQFAGIWSLAQREEPLGTIVEEFTDGDGPLRLQAPGGLFIEVRIPDAAAEGEHKQASFGGNYRVGSDKSQTMCTQFRSIDFQPPSVEVPKFQVTLSSSSMEAVGHPAGDFRELWARLSTAEEKNFVALELQSEVPEPKVPRTGIWIFAGNRFARLVGLPRGTGLVAGTCCRSLGQLQRLRGYAEVRYELHQNYEVLTGFVEEPGLLRIKRMAWQPTKADTIFYSSNDEATGEVVVGQDCIVHIHPGGRRDTWRIVEWTFDPFTPSSSAVAEKDRSPSSSCTKARSHSSAKDGQEEEEAGPEAKSPSQASPDAGDTDKADDESDKSDVESDAEKRDPSPAPPLCSPSASPAAEAPEAAGVAEEAGKSEDAEKSEDDAKVEEKTERSRRKARKAAAEAAVAAVEAAAAEASRSPKRKNAKEPKEKKKKKKRKASPAADEEKDGAASDAVDEAADAKKKKKKKKKGKKHKKEKAAKEEEEEEVADDKAASADEDPAEKADASPAAAPGSPKSAAGSSPKASPAPASAPPSPAAQASAPNSPVGRASGSPERSPKRSSPKRASPEARGGRGKRGRDRDEGRRGKQRSPSRGRKKDRKRNASQSPLKRSSPARKRGGSPPAKRSSPARKRSPKRGSSRRKRGSPPAKRSPAPRSGGSRSRSGGRGRGGRGKDRNRSGSGTRADRRGGDRKGSRSRSGHGGKKRKKGRD